MDITDEEKRMDKEEEDRMKERLGLMWNPTSKERLQFYQSWLLKQANQRQKTLELDGVTHSRDRKDQLRREKRAFEEKFKEIRDKIKDGGR